MGFLKKLFKILLLISIILLVASYFLKNRLPRQGEILPELATEPLQTPTTAPPREYSQKGVSYKVIPQYDYELYGLVVSQNDNEVWYSRFKKTDPSNTKDYCVLWGKNLDADVYNKITFRTEEFVCKVRYRADDVAADDFSMTELSNNHLLTADDSVYKAIRAASVGDQIHLKGYLVNYEITNSAGEKASRGTSTTRTDEGMGACETIYVNDFEILKKGNQTWWTVFQAGPYAIGAEILLLVFLSIITAVSKTSPSRPPDLPNKDILLPPSVQNK